MWQRVALFFLDRWTDCDMSGLVQEYKIGSFPLQSGQVLPDARLVYQTFGKLNAARDNAVLFPTWYSSKHEANSWLIGEGRALDPRECFIIVPNLFGNGYSSSPSNTGPSYDRSRFPRVTIYDNVMAQLQLVEGLFKISQLALYIGRSMGAMAAFHWAALFPQKLRGALMLTGASRCAPHNYVFLASLKAALTADNSWQDGEYLSPPLAGMAAFGRIYAAWIYSHDWYRRSHGGTDAAAIERFLQQNWDRTFLNRDANDLLSQIDTWQTGDISANSAFNGDHAVALAAISARCIVMPSQSDLYFRPEDSAREVAMMRNAELRVIASIHGHRAGTAASEPEDVAFVSSAIKELLQ